MVLELSIMRQPMPKEINCLNFKGLFAFLEKQYGSYGINTVVNGLVGNSRYLIKDIKDPSKIVPIKRSQMVDLNYWVSNEFSLKLMHNVNKVVRADNPLFEAGRGAVRESLSKHALFAGKLFGPFLLAKKATKINARFNRTKQVIYKKLNGKELAFELCYYPHFEVTKDICNWNLGIYTELLHSSGVKNVHAEEVKCVLNGDHCCEFRLKWKKSGIIARMVKGLSIWQVKQEVRHVIEEYEGSLQERDHLINQLAGSEEKYRSLFENTATANAILESDLTITLVNSEFEALVGHKKRDIENQWNLKDLIKKSDLSTAKTHLSIASPSDQRRSKNLEFCLVTKNRLQRDVICKIGRIPNSSRIIASMIDITEMKRAQKEKMQLKSKLARSEKMEALGLLAGGVAHDLNNVLSGIVSYPELLLLDLPQDSHLRKPIQTIKESGLKASAIVQDLLTLARRDVADKEVVNLNAVIDDYLQSPEYDKMISFHPGVGVVFESDPRLFNIQGVPLNLNKAVMNLITNAAEAIDSDGTIQITTKNCYLERPIAGYERYREGEYVSLRISDSGVGIEKKDIERIFEPFYSKKVMGRSGTGLGMTVVWGTVADHDGHIDVVSESGKGTTFNLLFPATREGLTEKAPNRSLRQIMGNGESVLVVDDVQEQRELAGSILTRLGYDVDDAPSGEQALERIKAGQRFDLILLDMIMHPGMDGLETYKQLRAITPNQKTIIVSGFSETSRVKHAQSMGAGAYVKKPYLLDRIGAAVKDELKK
jgi:PAS domain S-box-containing protein